MLISDVGRNLGFKHLALFSFLAYYSIPMYTVQKLFQRHRDKLAWELLCGKAGLRRRISIPEVHRPGLFLAGYQKARVAKRILILGKAEVDFLRDMDPSFRKERLSGMLGRTIPAVCLTRHLAPPKDLFYLCEERNIPLLRSALPTMHFLNQLSLRLAEDLSTTVSCHGTLIEVFGVGLLVLGDSSVGKSEAALGLVERGHRLVSDDVVHFRKREDRSVEGFGAELTRHHMEIRGIGIINIAKLYGAVCVRESKKIDIVVQMEEWNDNHFYDRIGLDESFTTILEVRLPYMVLPVKPGRDVVLLLETIALNHRLKEMGYHSAKEFNKQWIEIAQENAKKRKAKHG